MIFAMANWKTKTWRTIRYLALNLPIAVLAYWLPYKDGIPALGWLWAACVMIGDPGTPLMVASGNDKETS